MHPVITSPQNPKIKHLLSLEKPRTRRAEGLFVVEGRKEIALAREGGYTLRSLFYCPDLITEEAIAPLTPSAEVLLPVSRDVFDRIAVRENSGGVIAVAEQKEHRLAALRLSANPLILVLESVEKPGNLGAVLRTADAGALDAVIICDPRTDFYNANVIRSSLGCVFTNQVASANSAETLAWLKKHNIRVYSTYLQAAVRYDTADYTGPCAIVMGTEATGLSDTWLTPDQHPVIIPMRGKIDSMNVSTAAAVVVFEALRQRGFT